MPLTRREFNKSAVMYPVLASVASAGLLTPEKAEAMSLSVFIPDYASFMWVTTGPCCWWCPNMVTVAHYLPVALIEVISGGDSILGVSLGLNAVQIANYDEDEMSAHIRIWELNDAIAGLMFGGKWCMLCKFYYARLFDFLLPEWGDWYDVDGMPAWMASACNAGAKAATKVVDKITDAALDSLFAQCIPKLLYTSETDFGWLTGCRDWLNWSSYTSGPMCETAKTGDDCMGLLWGALYPRQRTVMATHPSLGAAILAYKGLHTYAYDLGNFPFLTDIRFCRMSMIYPDLIPGGLIGGPYLTSMLKNDPLSIGPTREMKYGFVWWVPVVCCKSYHELWGACIPPICWG